MSAVYKIEGVWRIVGGGSRDQPYSEMGIPGIHSARNKI